MLTNEDINHQQQMLQIYRRNLAQYVRQQAAFGGGDLAPPMVVNGIYEVRENIKRIKSILRKSGVSVEDHPDDDEQQQTVVAPVSASVQSQYPPTPPVPTSVSARDSAMAILRVTITGSNAQTDPLAVLVTLDSFDGSTDRLDATSRLPFDNQVQLPALLRVLDVVKISQQTFSDDELAWLRAEGFIESDDGSDYVSPKMQPKIGERLFRCLFPSEAMRDMYRLARRQSADRGVQIQLTLDVNAPLIGAQPWELLFDGDEFLFIGGRGALTRYLPLGNPPPARSLSSALRILLINPRPSDLTLLDSTEAQAVRAALSRLPSTEIQSLDRQTRDALMDYLFDSNVLPHLIHFDGHGVFGRRCLTCGAIETSRSSTRCSKAGCGRPLNDRRQGFLMFENDQGRADPISAEDFADLIGQARAGSNSPDGISLVVLSACRSAVARGEENVFNGVAQAARSTRIPAVVAMQFRPLSNKAARFARSLYRSIANGQPLVSAVSRGRTELGREGDHWYRPVLYLRWRDNDGGKLFKIS